MPAPSPNELQDKLAHLKHAETEVKNTVPTKETIEEEKKLGTSEGAQ